MDPRAHWENIYAIKAGNQTLSNFDLEMGRYNRLVTEGIEKCATGKRADKVIAPMPAFEKLKQFRN